MKKQGASLVLFIMLLFFFLTSCGQKEQQGEQKSDGIKGETFYFIGSFIPYDNQDDSDNTVSDAYEKTVEDDAMLDSLARTEEKLGCKIICTEGFSGTRSDLASSLASGSLHADIMCENFSALLDFYKGGVLCDLYQIETFNAEDEEKWGTAQRKESTSYRGALYAIPRRGSMYCPYTDMYNGAFVYNKSLYDSYGLDADPQELIESKKWDFDGFLSLLPKLIALDSDPAKYGISLYNSLPTISVYANGGDIIIKNEKGLYTFGYSRDNAVHALEWARSVSLMPGAISPGTFYTDFETGNTVFCLITAERALHSSVSELGWLPFPYGPDVEYGSSYSSYFGYGEKGTSIIKNSDERNAAVGMVFNELFEPTDKFGKTGYDEYMSRNYFDTPEDYAVYKSHGLNMHYDWSKEILKNKTVGEALSKINDFIANPAAPIKTEMVAIRDVINRNICDDLNGN